MSMPSDYPLDIYHGDSYHWQFQLWLDLANTQPLDLTGVTVKAEIRDKPGGTQIFPIDCEVVLPNLIEAVLTAPVCKTLPIADDMAWDLQLTYPTGSVNTMLAGKVKVVQDVTDAVVPAAMQAEAAEMPKAVRLVKQR
jgi:hypothetical protein